MEDFCGFPQISAIKPRIFPKPPNFGASNFLNSDTNSNPN